MTDRVPVDRGACSSVQERVVEVINEPFCGDIVPRKLPRTGGVTPNASSLFG